MHTRRDLAALAAAMTVAGLDTTIATAATAGPESTGQKARDELRDQHGVTIHYVDDRIIDLHRLDGMTAHPGPVTSGWYYFLDESFNFAGDLYGPFGSRKATLQAMLTDLADYL
jgi:hypothetical protein